MICGTKVWSAIYVVGIMYNCIFKLKKNPTKHTCRKKQESIIGAETNYKITHKKQQYSNLNITSFPAKCKQLLEINFLSPKPTAVCVKKLFLK